MIDPQLLRKDFDAVAAACLRRGYEIDAGRYGELEGRRKSLQEGIESLRSERKRQSREFGAAKGKGEGADPAAAAAAAKEHKERMARLEEEFRDVRAELDALALDIPNLLDESVPDGRSAEDNPVVRTFSEPPEFEFEPQDHVALGESLGMMDFERAGAVAGSRFVILKGQLARLHRALIQFMLDKQTGDNGYEELYVPVLINEPAMTGTGQLPKFEEDLFRVDRDGLYLAPTAEVPVTNVVRERILDESELPMKFACHAPCFRREAGSYGKDTRGMLRQHQFEKVELVRISHPDRSDEALEEMAADAESVLRELDLPYRVVVLCGGDTGFAARKTYDIEVWLPGQGLYREISSCSNCGDFQARRMQARFRDEGKTRLVHTLNGSGVAVGRALIAVMENYQEGGGSISVPDALRPYMGDLRRIEAPA